MHVIEEGEEGALGCAVFALLAFGGLAVAGVVQSWAWWWTAILIVLALGAALITLSAIDDLRSWEALRLEFEEWPLLLGSPSSLRIVRPSKKDVNGQEIAIGTTLICREWVQFTERDVDGDTSTTYEEQDVFTDTYTEVETASDSGVDFITTVEVPLHAGAPSMKFPNNKVSWYIKVELGDHFTKTIDVEVAAELGQGAGSK